MGWGCYKHEWDAGSENWDKVLSELCDRKPEERPLTFGRDNQVCPACFMEMERGVAALRAEVKAWREEVGIYEEDDSHTRKPRPPSCRLCASAEGQPHAESCPIRRTDETQQGKQP